ncbi:MAG TPA: hypothetical protein VG518_03915, partial [Solirubrobacterales bacterium]|nr:hypothetical protein [Solirubrobacterales bacterium]
YPAPKALGVVRQKGKRLLVRVRCPAAWLGCDKLLVSVHGAGKGAKRLLGKRRVARVGGGRKKVVSVRLRGSARRYLARLERKPRVRVTLRTAERLEPTIVARPLKRPKP